MNFEAFCFEKFEFYSKIFVYFESFWWFYANFVFIVFGSSWRGALPHCGYLRRALHAVCVLSPIQVLHPDKNTLLQVIICPLVLYWQRFLFRDFPKFKVLKKSSKNLINLERNSQSGKKKYLSKICQDANRIKVRINGIKRSARERETSVIGALQHIEHHFLKNL